MLKWLLTIVIALAIIALATPWLRRRGLGRLPGDLQVRVKGRDYYLPILSTIILSLIAVLIGRLI